MKTIRPLITKAFRQLAKEGYTTKKDFWCCQNCAWNALSEDELDKVVFYHHQDEEMLRKQNMVYLAWNGDGHRIVEILEGVGLEVTWNGNEETRILIEAKE